MKKLTKKQYGIIALSIVAIVLLTIFGVTTIQNITKKSQQQSNIEQVSVEEQGNKTVQNSIKIVELSGTWREMGQQYGRLMKSELQDIYTFTENIANASEKNQSSAKKTVEQDIAQCPYYLKEFFAGAAQTSGLTEYQLHVANSVERIAGLPQCSAAAVWGDYAAGNLIMGRNYDYSDDFKKMKDNVAVTVYHPADGSLAVATIGYVGEIYAVNAINEEGFFMELNNGKTSANVKSPNSRITGTTLLFDMMFETDDFEYMDRFFNTELCASSYIINVVNSKEAGSYEWCPTGVKRGDGVLPEGLLVSTNHYANPDWEFPVPTDDTSWQSITRRDNLINLCEESKGSIDADKMMQIIDTSVENGGAENELTVYQLVVEPETLTIWMQVKGGNGWTKIELESILNNK